MKASTNSFNGGINNILNKAPAWHIRYGLFIAFFVILIAFVILFNVKYREYVSFMATISVENRFDYRFTEDVKVYSILCKDGDTINQGSPLFILLDTNSTMIQVLSPANGIFKFMRDNEHRVTYYSISLLKPGIFLSGFVSVAEQKKIRTGNVIHIKLTKNSGQAAEITGVVKHISSKPSEDGYYLNILLTSRSVQKNDLVMETNLMGKKKVSIIHNNKTFGRLLFERLFKF